MEMLKQKNIKLLIVLSLLICSSAIYAQNKLIFAVTLIRHGDRTPCRPIPSSQYQWKLGLGALTPLGMRQEYELGKKFRERYVNQYHLLPSKYEYNSIYARSTDVDRTLMSAESFLLGLYPLGTGPMLKKDTPALPEAFQPIPVHTAPKNKDTLLNSTYIHKKQIKEMSKQYVFTTDEWKAETAQYSKNFDRWSKIFGKKIKTLADLKPMGSTLHVRLVHNVPLPKGLTKKEAEKIVEISDWTLPYILKPQKISRPITRVFMTELVKNIQEAINGKQEYKYILYSAHDITIVSVMSALGVPLNKKPRYASNLTFELFKNESGYYINLSFNGKEVQLPGVDKNKHCSIPEFKKLALGHE